MNIVDYNEALSLIESYKSDDDTHGYLYAIKVKGNDSEFGEWLLFSEFSKCFHLYERQRDDGSIGVYVQKLPNLTSGVTPRKWADVYKERDKIRNAEASHSLEEMRSLVKRTHSKVGKERIKELIKLRFGCDY